MESPSVCFNADAYIWAVADLNRAGFTFKNDATQLKGKYLCLVEDGKTILVEEKPLTVKYPTNTNFWVDRAGFSHRKITEIPLGVRIAMGSYEGLDGGSEEKSDLMTRGLKHFYQCELINDRACVNRELEIVRTELKGISEIEVAQARVNEARKIEMATRCISQLTKKAARLIQLATDENISELKIIYDKYGHLRSGRRLQTLKEAEEYCSQAANMFTEMIQTPSGYQTIMKSGEDIGCSARKETSDYGSDQIHIECPDVKITSTVKTRPPAEVQNLTIDGVK